MSHRPTAASASRRQRRRVVIAVVVIALLAFAGGGVLAALFVGDDPTVPDPAPIPTPSPTDPATGVPTSAPATDGPTASPAVAALEDGRHFVMARRVIGDATRPKLVLDLAEFYEGEDANAIAAERGDETPVPNDVYIVNDNPRLRRLAIDPRVDIRYIPIDPCCEPVAGRLDAWTAAVNRTDAGNYPDPRYTYWWIEVEDGAIVGIEQQYLP